MIEYPKTDGFAYGTGSYNVHRGKHGYTTYLYFCYSYV